MKEPSSGSREIRHGTPGGYTNRGCRCGECKAAKRDYQREYMRRHPQKPRPSQDRKSYNHKYPTDGLYRAAQLVEQGGVCGVCAEENPRVIDHDHKTLEVRGLLCDRCNIGLGKLRDDPEVLKNAIEYLSRVV